MPPDRNCRWVERSKLWGTHMLQAVAILAAEILDNPKTSPFADEDDPGEGMGA